MQADNYFFIKFFIERSITNKKISTLYVTRYHWSIEVVSSREIQVRLVLESLAELGLISGTQWVGLGLFGHYLCRPEQSAVPPGAERRNSPAQKCKKEFLFIYILIKCLAFIPSIYKILHYSSHNNVQNWTKTVSVRLLHEFE